MAAFKLTITEFTSTEVQSMNLIIVLINKTCVDNRIILLFYADGKLCRRYQKEIWEIIKQLVVNC